MLQPCLVGLEAWTSKLKKYIKQTYKKSRVYTRENFAAYWYSAKAELSKSDFLHDCDKSAQHREQNANTQSLLGEINSVNCAVAAFHSHSNCSAKIIEDAIALM